MSVEESLEKIARDLRWMRDTHDLIAMWLYDYCSYHPHMRDTKMKLRLERIMKEHESVRHDEQL